MKKIILSTLSIALIAGGMTSCGKSSTGKMSNEWTVDSYEIKEVDTDEDGDVTTTTTTITPSTMTRTQTSPSGNSTTTTTTTGTVSKSDYTINKDGTWSSAFEFTVSETIGGGISYATTTTLTNSGTWSFVGKNKTEDFKKNERVLFNTLTSTTVEKNTVTSNGSSNTTSSTTTDTYMTGDNSAIYTVTESKKDALKLTADAKNTNSETTNSTTTTSNAVTTTISLKAK